MTDQQSGPIVDAIPILEGRGAGEASPAPESNPPQQPDVVVPTEALFEPRVEAPSVDAPPVTLEVILRPEHVLDLRYNGITVGGQKRHLLQQVGLNYPCPKYGCGNGLVVVPIDIEAGTFNAANVVFVHQALAGAAPTNVCPTCNTTHRVVKTKLSTQTNVERVLAANRGPNRHDRRAQEAHARKLAERGLPPGTVGRGGGK